MIMNRSSIKSNNNPSHHQQSTQKQIAITTTPLVNNEVGQIIGKKAQLLFPQFQVEQEGFSSGDIESAIDHFVSNLQSPQNKFDLNSTIFKMRSIADEQEKKIQKSINKDNQYTEEDAFGFSSAVKYQFAAQFASCTEPQMTIPQMNGQNYSQQANQPILPLSVSAIRQQQSYNHQTASQPSSQVQEAKPFSTPLKTINNQNQMINSQANTTAKEGNKIKDSQVSATIQKNANNQSQTLPQQQPQQQYTGTPHQVNTNGTNIPNYPAGVGYPPHFQPGQYIPNQQHPSHIHANHQYQNTVSLPPHAQTAQKENNLPPHHFNHYHMYPHYQYHPFYNQLHFQHQPSPHPQQHLQPQQQHQQPVYHNNPGLQNENYNPMIFMSAPPSMHPYNGNTGKSMPRVNLSKNQQLSTSQIYPIHPLQYQNEQEQFKRQPLQQNNYHSNVISTANNGNISQAQQQQNHTPFGNNNAPSSSSIQQNPHFSYPIANQPLQQQDQKQITVIEQKQRDDVDSPTLKRINSLESVQQQLNFDIAKNEDRLLKSSSAHKMTTEDNLEIRQITNNSTNQNCLDDFLRQSRISCEEDILSNNKLTLSPSISNKDEKTDMRDLDRSMNQDSYSCQLMSGQRMPLSDQSNLLNLKSEGIHLEKSMRYDQHLKNSAFNDFLHYESNSELNFLMEENHHHHDHLNNCDFDKYME